jgi:hypothetical protein
MKFNFVFGFVADPHVGRDPRVLNGKEAFTCRAYACLSRLRSGQRQVFKTSLQNFALPLDSPTLMLFRKLLQRMPIGTISKSALLIIPLC